MKDQLFYFCVCVLLTYLTLNVTSHIVPVVELSEHPDFDVFYIPVTGNIRDECAKRRVRISAHICALHRWAFAVVEHHLRLDAVRVVYVACGKNHLRVRPSCNNAIAHAMPDAVGKHVGINRQFSVRRRAGQHTSFGFGDKMRHSRVSICLTSKCAYDYGGKSIAKISSIL